MLRVYVMGPYSYNHKGEQANVMEVLANMRRGIKASTNVFLNGMAPFCPWIDFFYALNDENSKLTIEDYYKYSLAWLDVSDASLVIEGWEKSKGTLKEIERVKELNIPLFYNLEDLIKWKEQREKEQVIKEQLQKWSCIYRNDCFGPNYISCCTACAKYKDGRFNALAEKKQKINSIIYEDCGIDQQYIVGQGNIIDIVENKLPSGAIVYDIISNRGNIHRIYHNAVKQTFSWGDK